jgi:hypothetical protein
MRISNVLAASVAAAVALAACRAAAAVSLDTDFAWQAHNARLLALGYT